MLSKSFFFAGTALHGDDSVFTKKNGNLLSASEILDSLILEVNSDGQLLDESEFEQSHNLPLTNKDLTTEVLNSISYLKNEMISSREDMFLDIINYLLNEIRRLSTGSDASRRDESEMIKKSVDLELTQLASYSQLDFERIQKQVDTICTGILSCELNKLRSCSLTILADIAEMQEILSGLCSQLSLLSDEQAPIIDSHCENDTSNENMEKITGTGNFNYMNASLLDHSAPLELKQQYLRLSNKVFRPSFLSDESLHNKQTIHRQNPLEFFLIYLKFCVYS